MFGLDDFCIREYQHREGGNAELSRGYAVSAVEFNEGVGVAAPIRDKSGVIVVSVAIIDADLAEILRYQRVRNLCDAKGRRLH